MGRGQSTAAPAGNQRRGLKVVDNHPAVSPTRGCTRWLKFPNSRDKITVEAAPSFLSASPELTIPGLSPQINCPGMKLNPYGLISVPINPGSTHIAAGFFNDYLVYGSGASPQEALLDSCAIAAAAGFKDYTMTAADWSNYLAEATAEADQASRGRRRKILSQSRDRHLLPFGPKQTGWVRVRGLDSPTYEDYDDTSHTNHDYSLTEAEYKDRQDDQWRDNQWWAPAFGVTDSGSDSYLVRNAYGDGDYYSYSEANLIKITGAFADLKSAEEYAELQKGSGGKFEEVSIEQLNLS